MALKLIFTALLACGALALAILRRAPLYWLVVAALAFSWLGDAALAGFPPLERLVRPLFPWGMGFFGLAHGCYITACVLFLRAHPQAGMRSVGILLVCAAAAVGIWLVLYRSGSMERLLLGLSFVYSMLLLLMMGSAWSAALRLEQVVWPLMLGSALFVASDCLIGAHWFLGWGSSKVGIAVWAMYAPAQVLLLAGFWMLRTPAASFAAAVM